MSVYCFHFKVLYLFIQRSVISLAMIVASMHFITSLATINFTIILVDAHFPLCVVAGYNRGIVINFESIVELTVHIMIIILQQLFHSLMFLFLC